MSKSTHTRRQFLGRSAIGATGVALGAFGSDAKRILGANDRISIGLIGCGGRGMEWIGDQIFRLKSAENAEITVVCDVWKKNRDAAVDQVGKWFGKAPRPYTRYAEVLALKDVDAVGIATPDFAHSPILADAARAKKDAYCEKPMATNLKDARNALHSVNENQIVCQVGLQRRSEGIHKAAAELLQSGVLGIISEVECAWHDHGPRWLRSSKDVRPEDVDWEQYQMHLHKRPFDPMRFRCWHLWKDYTVGTPGLLGSHLIDVAVWFMNDPLPLRAVSLGGVYVWKESREHPDTQSCIIEYPKGFIVDYSTRLANDYPVPEAIFYGTKGTFDTKSWTARGDGGGTGKLAAPIKVVAKGDENHVQNWLQCIRTRKTPNAPVETGYAHSIASILCYQSLIEGRRFCYDPKAERIYAG